MKRLLLSILLFTLWLDAIDYTQSWQRVDQFEKKYLPKSIIKEMENIYQIAKAENNSIEYLRASLGMMKYIERIESRGKLKQIERLEQALKEAPTREAELFLSSVLAQYYHNYLNSNSYQISQRSRDKKNHYSGIEGMEIKEILDRVHTLYRTSISQESRSIPIKKYEKLLTKLYPIQRLRPTLYDFLVFRAMEYFSNPKNYIYMPQEPFKFRDQVAFASIDSFAYHSFNSSDTEDAKYQTLLFYQKLLPYYKRTNLEAFDRLNVKRVSFVYENFEGEQRDQYYIQALEEIVAQNPKSVAIEKLIRYYQKQDKLVEAMGYIKQCIESNSTSYDSCQDIKSSIESKHIVVRTEQVNLPHENILAHISYRNSDEVFVKVIRLSPSQKKSLYKSNSNYRVSYLNSLKSLKTFSLSLPKAKRYKPSSTEVSLGSYEVGEYAFIFSTSSDFTKESFYKEMIISNLSYSIQQDQKRLLVVHRKTGEPLEGIFVQFRARGRWTLNRYSDKNGFVKIPDIGKSYTISLSHYDDRLDFRDRVTPAMIRGEAKPYDQVYFFTDRSLYRPEQTIFFKGLATRRFSNKAPKVLEDRDVTVTFTNGNGKKIASKIFTTDEYGSFHGTFTAPKGGLMGAMRITSDIGGATSISVEEYKRPKFETKFEGHSTPLRLGQEVTAKGVATAYAGNGIDGATVRYRIERSASFPWVGYRDRAIHSATKIIKSGELKTDSQGHFNIQFNAQEDEKIDAQKRPIYHYKVMADVIDTTGESHSTTTHISIGYIDFTVDLKLPPQLDIDDNKTIEIVAKDLDEKVMPIQGEIKIERYIVPNRVYRNRFWSSQVAQKSYSKEEFEKIFKHYRYSEERNATKKEKIKEINFDTSSSPLVDMGDLTQGRYLITLTTMSKSGEMLSRTKEVEIYDPNSRELLHPSYLLATIENRAYKVGEVARLDLKTTGQNIPMLLTLEQHDKIIDERWIRVKDNIDHELIKIKKRYQGNIHYRVNLVYENRPFSAQGSISVPWDTGLKVEYMSFRDKLKPNEKEQWKIKISGKNRDRVMAQMVATIYDASLDALKPHSFSRPYLYPYSRMGYRSWRIMHFGNSQGSGAWREPVKIVDSKNYFAKIKDLRMNYSQYLGRFYPREPRLNEYGEEIMDVEPVVFEAEVMPMPVPAPSPVVASRGAVATVVQNSSFAPPSSASPEESKRDSIPPTPPIHVRKNLQETMFFKGDLETDSEGNIIINFKSNEALTRWNFMGFVHTKDLKTAITYKSLSTQKELMVVTNLPRFFREKDQIKLSAKVVNMSDKDLSGTCELKLVNPLTQKPIFDHPFIKNITLPKGASRVVEFTITVPDVDKIPAIEHTIIARTDTHSDAEQVIKPILSNRIFITESKVLSLKEHESKKVVFESLKNSTSTTLSNYKLTLEFTSNPAWYAVRALPYLMEYPHECNEQLFSRYFANALSSHLINSHPKIAEVFKSWKSRGELKSALESNSKLKSILLQETPWVLNAQSQKQKLANLGLLFDLNHLAKEEKRSYKKLLERQKQNSDGGWAWFEAPKSSWYITQYIVTGFGKLKNLGIDKTQTSELKRAVRFLDSQVLMHYRSLQKRVEKGDTSFSDNQLQSILINYLYARSFYSVPMSQEIKKVHDYYLKQAFEFWKDMGLYEQATIALILHQNGQKERAKDLINSFAERLIVTPKGGYFKYKNGYHWNEMPIETHTLIMDAFYTIAHDKKRVSLMQKWLLKEKFSSHWKTTTATTSAIYALFAYDSKLLDSTELVEIDFETNIPYKAKLKEAMANAEAGTGYFKVEFEEFDQSMGTINLKNPNNIEAYGALYWQYFEDLDKVKSFRETPLTLKRRLYKMDGKKPIPIEQTELKVGDKVRVRIQLEVDKNMEYIMLKDSRASTFEPLNVLSGYQYRGGLKYYQSTKDSSTYFFIDYLPKGKYNFEYPVVVTHKGIFSNGISLIESMYAPEFRSHSRGRVVLVE